MYATGYFPEMETADSLFTYSLHRLALCGHSSGSRRFLGEPAGCLPAAERSLLKYPASNLALPPGCNLRCECIFNGLVICLSSCQIRINIQGPNIAAIVKFAILTVMTGFGDPGTAIK